MPEKLSSRTANGGARANRDAPALTLMDSPTFRVRMGSVGPARSPKAKNFIGRIKAMVRKHAAGAGGPRRARVSQFGRGGSAAAHIRVRSAPQRVAVKSRVVRHARYSGARGAGGALKDHIAYLQRAGVDREGSRGVLFDAETELFREEVQAFRERMVGDRHHFRFIVSPEAGARLTLKDYARELVTQMEADLGTKLQWLGVAHYDTDNPHLHLLVRGKDDRGGDLVISREYISHGMRLQAMELATRHLGPRLPEEIERSLERDLKADRVTGIDLGLVQVAARHPHGFVSALHSKMGSLAHERERLRTLTRLQHLESLGLAEEIAPGIWRPDIDLIERLRALSIRGDIIKLMHARMRGADPGISTVIFEKDRPPARSVVGRVYGRGHVDELSDREYLLVEARDGRAYYVPLSEYSEAKGEEARVGSIVRIYPAVKREGRAADRNIARLALGNGGLYDPDRHLEEVELRGRLPAGVSASDYVAAHVKRATALASRGLVLAIGEGRFRIPADLELQASVRPSIGRDGGRVIKVERLAARDLESQVKENGITWLDRELKRGASAVGSVRIGASRFERELAQALQGRAGHLKSLGLAEEIDGKLHFQEGFLDALYERELRDAALRLRTQYGELERLQEGQRIRGRVASLEALPSGPHWVLASDSSFALVPATSGIGRALDKTVALSVGRSRVFNPTQPMSFQLALRYRELTLGRALKR